MRTFRGEPNPHRYLKKVLTEAKFAKILPKLEIGLQVRRHLGQGLHDALYERLEIPRRHLGPCDSIHSIWAGLFMSTYLLGSAMHTIAALFCVAALLSVLVSWVVEFASGTWRTFLGGILTIILYLHQTMGIISAARKGGKIALGDRCVSIGGTLVIDLMMQDGGLLTLLPVGFYVSERRGTKNYNRALTELEWIRASFGFPDSVYDPWSFYKRNNHPIGRALLVFWAQFKRKR